MYKCSLLQKIKKEEPDASMKPSLGLQIYPPDKG
jgi:hypothetical protein